MRLRRPLILAAALAVGFVAGLATTWLPRSAHAPPATTSPAHTARAALSGRTLDQLPAVGALGGSELFLVEQGGVSNKGTLSTLLNAGLPSTLSLTDKGGQGFNVKAYGAKGDGTTDDTAAWQAAIDAAVAVNGTVIIPPPPVQWMLGSSPLVIQPGGSKGSGSGQCRLTIQARGNYQAIQYNGPSNSSLFVLHGCKDSEFVGLNVNIPNTTAGVLVWDMQPTLIAGSMSWNTWRKCRINFGTGGRCIGWRTGQSDPSATFSDHAEFRWEDCNVTGLGRQYGDIGWQLGGSQTIPSSFTNCSASQCWRRVLSDALSTTSTSTINAGDATINVVSTTGFNPAGGSLSINGVVFTYTGLTSTTFTGCSGITSSFVGFGYVVTQYVTNVPGGVAVVGAYIGAESFSWIGGGGSSNGIDFQFANGGGYRILGDRAESGQRYLQCSAGASAGATTITCLGVEWAAYAPTDGVLFQLNAAVALGLENCTAYSNATPFGAAMISTGSASSFGLLTIRNCNLYATDPFYTIPSGWVAEIDNVQLTASTQHVTAYANRPARTGNVIALAYGATVTPDPQKGETQTLSLTATGAITIANPATSRQGQRLTLFLTNNAGGAITGISFGTHYHTDGSFAPPASGKTRSIRFVCTNGTNWWQDGPASADMQ